MSAFEDLVFYPLIFSKNKPLIFNVFSYLLCKSIQYGFSDSGSMCIILSTLLQKFYNLSWLKSIHSNEFKS